ncbi:unnamed protein product [Cylicocyclus nassatus]|uniref:Uncharacterized protein n=1 Tax=Cylicocyclus nassatus TaxID=53992 RepID=A0AA36DNZ2_CYLNA|nr:unnamed protein product [Cylicocyclus nassatus]
MLLLRETFVLFWIITPAFMDTIWCDQENQVPGKWINPLIAKLESYIACVTNDIVLPLYEDPALAIRAMECVKEGGFTLENLDPEEDDEFFDPRWDCKTVLYRSSDRPETVADNSLKEFYPSLYKVLHFNYSIISIPLTSS